jgi:L-ascorbate metabolism protein UlaG (beta-lactamase superfamily)
MNRRTLLKFLGAPALLAMGGTAWASYARSRNPYYAGPVSHNFDGVRFFNANRPVTKGFTDFMRWQMSGGREDWPQSYATLPQDRPPERVTGLRVTHIGHASFLVQASGLNMLIDPVYGERASPVSFAGPKRVNAPGVAFENLPPIDVVLITHNHYDHLDGATLKRLWARNKPRIVTPLGNDVIIRALGEGLAAEAHDWDQRVPLSDKVAVTPVESYHWSARGALDRRMALWASFVIETPAGKIYHVGDTGYHDGSAFKRHRTAYGPFTLAMLPIGAYEPRWFMSDNHMNPAEAVQVFQHLEAQTALGHHWGTFKLTNEGIERPVAALDAALREASIAPERFRASRPGAVWEPAVS